MPRKPSSASAKSSSAFTQPLPTRPPVQQRAQRVAAYCVIHDAAGRVLLTELSDKTSTPGAWTLPGGGVEFGEDPAVAAVREVHEETGLDVELGPLLTIHSQHFTRGRVNSHAIRIVYRARVVGGTLQVLDLGGSTSAAAWFTPDELASITLVPLLRDVLNALPVLAEVPPAFTLAHVQLAIPVGAETVARAFWVETLGFVERTKPAALSARGGAWFEYDTTRVHVGVEEPFAPARKAHPAFAVADLDALAQRLAEKGHDIRWSDEVPGTRRFHTDDPFGNRLEFC